MRNLRIRRLLQNKAHRRSLWAWSSRGNKMLMGIVGFHCIWWKSLIGPQDWTMQCQTHRAMPESGIASRLLGLLGKWTWRYRRINKVARFWSDQPSPAKPSLDMCLACLLQQAHRCPRPRLLFQTPKRLRLLRLLRLLRVLWVLCLVRHGVTMFSSRCRIFSSRCPSLHSMDGTNNSGHRCHHKKIPGSNVPNRILSNGSGTAVNVVIIAVEISSEVEDMTMTPEADETTSVGLGFTVSASNSQFSRHHGNYLI